MRRLVLVFAAIALLAAPAARAEGTRGGLGFRGGFAGFETLPIAFSDMRPALGSRQWINDRVGVDFGVGYNRYKAEIETVPGSTTISGFVFEIGVPVLLKQVSENVQFQARPGFLWGSLEDKDETTLPAATVKYTAVAIMAELEVEWMVAEGLSVSASHGIAWHRAEDNFSPKLTETLYRTFGNNFTSLGFHVYLW